MSRPSAHDRGYNWTWRRARAEYLQRHPLCVMCLSSGVVATANVVDHIKPHKGDPVLFRDEGNWQSLCTTHHNSTKQRSERLGHEIGASVDGLPMDTNHPWHTDHR